MQLPYFIHASNGNSWFKIYNRRCWLCTPISLPREQLPLQWRQRWASMSKTKWKWRKLPALGSKLKLIDWWNWNRPAQDMPLSFFYKEVSDKSTALYLWYNCAIFPHNFTPTMKAYRARTGAGSCRLLLMISMSFFLRNKLPKVDSIDWSQQQTLACGNLTDMLIS